MIRIINHYDNWAPHYDNNINPTRDLDKLVTKKSLYSLNFSNVLELGCGSGKNTEWLITQADKLVGLDCIQSAEKAGFTLLEKKDQYDDETDLPRLISFLFEKPK